MADWKLGLPACLCRSLGNLGMPAPFRLLPVYLPQARLKDFLGLESGVISNYILLWVCGVGFLEFAVCCLGLAWRVRRTM